METNESIAYEIAMLVKENRELREQLKASENKYHDLLHEYDNVCRIIEEERLKSKPARKQREYNLYDAPHEIEHGSKIVITECFGNEAKFPKGFVMKVSSVFKTADKILENEKLFIQVNADGTLNIKNKTTKKDKPKIDPFECKEIMNSIGGNCEVLLKKGHGFWLRWQKKALRA